MEDSEGPDTSIAHDRGYASRKLWFCVFSAVLIVVSARFTPAVTIPTVVAGLVTIVGIYVTGRSIVQWQAGNIERTTASSNTPVNKAIDNAVKKVANKVAKESEEVDVDDRG
jgi:xanthosine utilization system XapX-like protein